MKLSLSIKSILFSGFASVIGTASLLVPLSSTAQGFPNKPIRMIVPFPAGTATDIVARSVASVMGTSLGQNVLVENKAGADGAIAGNEVARAAADGYTLLFATNSPMSAVPAMKKAPPYDPNLDFTPIVDIGRYTFFVVTHPSIPANSISELAQYAKANPGKLNYGTGNTTGILSVAQIAHLTGIQMVQVPYKGEPQALTDLISGRVHLMVLTAGATVAQVRDGKLKALAVTLPQRSPALPNVPTIYEAGVSKFSLTSWAGVFAPAKLPKEIGERLNKEFNAALQRPEVKAVAEKQAFQLLGGTQEKLGALVKEQLESYRGALKIAGMEPE